MLFFVSFNLAELTYYYFENAQGSLILLIRQVWGFFVPSMPLTTITTDSLLSSYKLTMGLLLRPWSHTKLGFSPTYATFPQCHLWKIIFTALNFLIYITKVITSPRVAMRVKHHDVCGVPNMIPGCLLNARLLLFI